MKPQIIIVYALFIVAMMYFRNKKKQQIATQRSQIDKAPEGAEVVTTSGMYGFIHSVENDVVWLEIADGCVVRVAKPSIARVVTPAPEALPPITDGPSAPEEAD